MKKDHLFFAILLRGIGLFATPLSADAAKIFINPLEKGLVVGNTTIIKVMVDTGGQEINAAEGIVKLDTSAQVVSLNTGGSIFDLWARKPSFENGNISFTGGSTSGVYGGALRIFSIAVKPTSVDSVKINFENSFAYLNDGKGTKIVLDGSAVELPVAQTGEKVDEMTALSASDTTAPAKFSIELGRDQGINDGKYFVSFYATDDASGINRYEVIENGLPAVRSGNVYVLQDQTLSGVVEVRAIDNAGNVRTETLKLKAEFPWLKTILVSILALGVLVAAFIIFRKKR